MYLFKSDGKLGVVVSTCNPSSWEAGQEEHDFEISPTYMRRNFLENAKQTNKENDGLLQT
jgi:hypothetical protein